MIIKQKSVEKVAKFANVIIGGAIFVCILTFFYYSYYYGWAHERYFTGPLGPVLYYILPVTLAGLLLFTFRLQPAYRVNLSLLLLSIGVSIYVVEVGLAFSNSILSRKTVNRTPSIVKIAHEFGVDFDTRTKLDLIRDLESHNIRAIPAIAPGFLLKRQGDGTEKSMVKINGVERLPLGGIANTVTVFCNEEGKYVIYESDEHGFHNPKGIWNAGHVDIAAVGDSFVQGYCVPSDQNFVSSIRKHYPATLNLGEMGNGPLTELATLKEYLPSLRPKVVLWFYFEGNDLDDLAGEERSPLLMSYLRNNFTQNLLNQQADIDQALMTLVKTLRNTGKLERRGEREPLEAFDEANGKPSQLLVELEAITKLAHVRQRLGLISGRSHRNHESDTDLDLFSKILSQAKLSVDTWGGKLAFVYLPAWARYADPAAINKIANQDSDRILLGERYRDQILVSVQAIGVPVVDIHRAFSSHSDPLALFPFRERGHYTEEGHRLVAEDVLQSISLVNSNSVRGLCSQSVMDCAAGE